MHVKDLTIEFGRITHEVVRTPKLSVKPALGGPPIPEDEHAWLAMSVRLTGLGAVNLSPAFSGWRDQLTPENYRHITGLPSTLFRSLDEVLEVLRLPRHQLNARPHPDSCQIMSGQLTARYRKANSFTKTFRWGDTSSPANSWDDGALIQWNFLDEQLDCQLHVQWSPRADLMEVRLPTPKGDQQVTPTDVMSVVELQLVFPDRRQY